MDRDHAETLIGAGTVVVAAAVLALAYGAAGSAPPGYDLGAAFDRVDGISVGSPVLLAGVRIGSVTAQRLDSRFRAVLTLHVAPGTELPADSLALVRTDGILGAKFIAIDPGGEPTNLKPGDRFRNTQDSMSVTTILQLIIDEAKSNRASPGSP